MCMRMSVSNRISRMTVPAYYHTHSVLTWESHTTFHSLSVLTFSPLPYPPDASHRHAILLAVSSMVLQTLHQESIRNKRSAVAPCTIGGDAGTGAGDSRGDDSDSHSNDSHAKASIADDTAVTHKVHARIDEYLPIIDALVTYSGVQNIPHVREEQYSRKSEGLNAEEKKIFDAEFNSRRKRIVHMLHHSRESSGRGSSSSSEGGSVGADVLGCHDDSNNSSSSIAKSEGGAEVEIEDASLETIPRILRATEDLLEAIAVFGLEQAAARPHLLNGAAVQELLKKIPRGDAFGDVRHTLSVLLSLLCVLV